MVVKPTEGQGVEENTESTETSSGEREASILVNQVVTSDGSNNTFILDINGQQHALHIDPDQMVSQPDQSTEVMELTLDPGDLQEVQVEVLPDMTFRTADGQILQLTQEVGELEQTTSDCQDEAAAVVMDTVQLEQMETQETVVTDLSLDESRNSQMISVDGNF